MTATLPDETSLASLLGTVEEAMTVKVLALAADTPADVAARYRPAATTSRRSVIR